jgi:hypothetical protein
MPPPSRRHLRRRRLLRAALVLPWWWSLAPVALARGIDLQTLALHQEDGALNVEFSARLTLSSTVDDALQRGLPIYFVAEASLYRQRWYWRDLRVARVRRTWRLAFQPLTATWRVSLGGLTQTFATQAEALAALSTAGRWKLADLSDLEPGATHYVSFSYRLDTSQLPGPMQFGVDNQSGWDMQVERELPLE